MSEKEETVAWYVDVWKRSLRELAGWSESRITDWVKARLDKFEGDYVMMEHQPPAYWIIEELISEDLQERLGPRKSVKLASQILQAIENGDALWHDDPTYDWQAARGRVESLLRGRGRTG